MRPSIHGCGLRAAPRAPGRRSRRRVRRSDIELHRSGLRAFPTGRRGDEGHQSAHGSLVRLALAQQLRSSHPARFHRDRFPRTMQPPLALIGLSLQ